MRPTAGNPLVQFSVPRVDRGGVSYIPVFSNEMELQRWSSDYQCLSLLGADVAEVVSSLQSGVILNPGNPDECAWKASELAEPTQSLTDQLTELFQQHSFVSEVFVKEPEGTDVSLLLGILYCKISPEDRFHLLNAIAEVSTTVFGSAGAIEVYDDLHLKHSASWELFKTLSPFFQGGTMAAEESAPETPLPPPKGRRPLSRIFARP